MDVKRLVEIRELMKRTQTESAAQAERLLKSLRKFSEQCETGYSEMIEKLDAAIKDLRHLAIADVGELKRLLACVDTLGQYQYDNDESEPEPGYGHRDDE